MLYTVAYELHIYKDKFQKNRVTFSLMGIAQYKALKLDRGATRIIPSSTNRMALWFVLPCHELGLPLSNSF